MLSVMTFRVRERSQDQIMVTDQCRSIPLPVVSVQSVCAECVQRVIVIVNTYSIVDSERGRVGTMVGEFKHAD